MNFSAFKDHLIAAMDDKKIDENTLAEKSGLSYISIYGYLRGNHEPNFQSLMKICNALGMTMDEFMMTQNKQ